MYEITHVNMEHTSGSKFYELLKIIDVANGSGLLIKKYGKAGTEGKTLYASRISSRMASEEYERTYKSKTSRSHHDGPYIASPVSVKTHQEWSDVLTCCHELGYDVNSIEESWGNFPTDLVVAKEASPVVEIKRPETWGIW